MPLDFRNVCLGRKQHDPARLAAVEPHRMAAEAPPPPIVTPPEGFAPELCRNDTLPTCTDAGLINAARIWTLRRGFDLRYDVNLLLGFYARVAGVPVSAIAATDGLVMLDVLESAQRDGYQINGQDTLVPIFHRLDTASAIRQAIAATGCAYVGVDLDEADMTEDWTARPLGQVIGGHCIDLIGYHPGGFVAATWGTEKLCDEGWLMPRLQEAYAVTWPMATA